MNLSGWTREDALCFLARSRETVEGAGLHLGLTGSLLYKDASTKDMDLIVYPRKTTAEISLKKARECLVKIGMKQLRTREQVAKSRVNVEGELDLKHVEVWEYEKSRIDVFFMCF